jgi:hypothetical protein
MARLYGFDQGDSGWRDMAWAGVAAALVTLLLVAGVALAWMVGRGPTNSPALGASEMNTPTPRALSFARTTPQPDRAETPQPQNLAATAVPTAAALSMALEADDNTSQLEPIAEFSRRADFRQLAAGSWSADGDALVNPGKDAISERWLTLATVPAPTFVIEAEIRVTGVLETVCDQSFGVIGGSPEAGLVFGGGVIFPCSGDGPMVRLTDATTWQDGYNGDEVIASESFDPGDDWRTYRFELRGDRLRVLVDGVGVVSAKTDPGIDPAATDAEAGIWSQGAGVEVRKVRVLPLPD